MSRIFAWARLAARDSAAKDVEIPILRHQLAVAQRRDPRLARKLTWADRSWLALLAGLVPKHRIGRIRWITPESLTGGAYWGTGCIVPHRKRRGRPLPAVQEADNTEHRRVRARVEHVLARMKNYKILRDCRVRGDGLHTAVLAVATMHNLAMAT